MPWICRPTSDAASRAFPFCLTQMADKIRKEASKSHKERVSEFNKYLESIAGDLQDTISAFTGIGSGMIYARQVLDTLHSGASLRTSGGEFLVLEAGAMRSRISLGGIYGG